MATSPTQRTLAYWRGPKMGGIAAVVERRIPYCFVTVDLWGFCDVTVVHPLYSGTVYIQTTSAPNLQARVKKLTGTQEVAENVRRILQAGNTVLVEGWAKRMKAGRCHKVERRCVHVELRDGEIVTWEEGA